MHPVTGETVKTPSIHRDPASAMTRLLGELAEELSSAQRNGLRRRLVTVDALHGPIAQIQGREVVCWCSNDYLGLSAHPRLIDAAAKAARNWGIGARASRLLGGTSLWHARLEEALAAWFGAEAGIVYASGYLANLGTLSALLSPGDLIVADRLVHASLLDAMRATRATVRVFRHNDVAHAADLLARGSKAQRRLIMTEGVFSMDGDCAPLAALSEVAQAHDTLIYLDDAHGAFVMGATGRGSPEVAGIAHDRFLYMGTLGKALGAQGGFVVGPRTLIEFLHNRARTFIYATALAIPVAAAAHEALCVIEQEPQHRRMLDARVSRLHAGLPRRHAPAAPSHIMPVILGETSRAALVAQRLWERGIWAPAIRPPTVPRGTSRLRLSVTALHTDEHVDALAAALRECLADA